MQLHQEAGSQQGLQHLRNLLRSPSFRQLGDDAVALGGDPVGTGDMIVFHAVRALDQVLERQWWIVDLADLWRAPAAASSTAADRAGRNRRGGLHVLDGGDFKFESLRVNAG